MLAGASPHDRRSGDNCDFALRLARCRSSSPISRMMADFGSSASTIVVDELKQIRVRCRSLHGHHTDSLVANDNLVAFVNVEKFDGTRGAVFFGQRRWRYP